MKASGGCVEAGAGSVDVEGGSTGSVDVGCRATMRRCGGQDRDRHGKWCRCGRQGRAMSVDGAVRQSVWMWRV